MLSKTTSQKGIERENSERKNSIRIGDCDINPGPLKKPRLLESYNQKNSQQKYEEPTIFNWGNLSPEWNYDSLDWDYIFPAEIRSLIDELRYENPWDLPSIFAFDPLYKRPSELHVTAKWIYDKLDFILDSIFMSTRLESAGSLEPKTFLWRQGAKFHRKNGLPAIMLWDGTKVYLENGLLHRVSGPAIDSPNLELWFTNGVWHNPKGPAFIEFESPKTSQGSPKPWCSVWLLNGQLSREEDEPAYRTPACLKWYLNGKASRTCNKPAVISIHCLKNKQHTIDLKWYTDGVLNRKGDDPAVILQSGMDLIWYIDGVKTRKNGNPHRVTREDNPVLHMGSRMRTPAGYRVKGAVLLTWYSDIDSEILRDNYLKKINKRGNSSYLGDHLGAADYNSIGSRLITSICRPTTSTHNSSRSEDDEYENKNENENEKQVQRSQVLIFDPDYSCVKDAVEHHWHKKKDSWAPRDWLKGLMLSVFSSNQYFLDDERDDDDDDDFTN